jgi:hypothetical protein
MRKKLGRILPWAVTLGLLFYVFRSISFSEILAAFATAAYWTVPVLMVLCAGRLSGRFLRHLEDIRLVRDPAFLS